MILRALFRRRSLAAELVGKGGFGAAEGFWRNSLTQWFSMSLSQICWEAWNVVVESQGPFPLGDAIVRRGHDGLLHRW